jgi:hypothetical protein
MGRWLVWIPILMVAALLYWTVALGLGGLSLMAVSNFSGGEEAGGAPMRAEPAETDSAGMAVAARDGLEPIVVRLEESVEPEDVDDNAGSGLDEDAGEAAEARAQECAPGHGTTVSQGIAVDW